MKLIIRQCKYCQIHSDHKCLIAMSMRGPLRGIHKHLSATCNCYLYPKLFMGGERVKIKMHNQVFNEYDGDGGRYEIPEWEEIGEFEGHILGLVGNNNNMFVDIPKHQKPIPEIDLPYIINKKFYVVKLDAPMKVTRIKENALIEVEVVCIKKLAKDIVKINKEVSTNV